MLARDLFSVETNIGFGREAAAAEEIRYPAQAFGLAATSQIWKISKLNINSTLYEVVQDAGATMLRRSPLREKPGIDRQCEILSQLRHDDILKPMHARDGGYTVTAGGHVWIAYRKLPGAIFDGRNADPLAVIDQAFNLLNVLGDVEEGQGRSLPRAHYAALPSEWIMELLFDEKKQRDSGFDAAMSSAIRARLSGASSEFTRALAAAATIPPSAEPQIVHNDLQHANVLIDDSRTKFLDIEDIVLGCPRIAAAHCVFKMLRHSVYGGVRLEEVQAKARSLPGLLSRHRSWSVDPALLVPYAAFRILSDIVMICRTYIEGVADYTYDLEKKICNVLELKPLFGKSAWT